MDSALSLFLDYPDESIDRASVAAEAPPGLAGFAGWWSASPLQEVQARYVADLDLRGRTSLFLTYHRFGDDRARGRALIALKRLYREAGFELAHWELPDYLPLVVELAAVAPEVGIDVLAEFRREIEAISAALEDAGSPFAAPLAALAAEIPLAHEEEVAV